MIRSLRPKREITWVLHSFLSKDPLTGKEQSQTQYSREIHRGKITYRRLNRAQHKPHQQHVQTQAYSIINLKPQNPNQNTKHTEDPQTNCFAPKNKTPIFQTIATSQTNGRLWKRESRERIACLCLCLRCYILGGRRWTNRCMYESYDTA